MNRLYIYLGMTKMEENRKKLTGKWRKNEEANCVKRAEKIDSKNNMKVAKNQEKT